MKIEILQIARLEFENAQEFYELEQSGLGARFENEIRQALLRIQQYPKVWSTERKEIRRCFIHKFPYKIIYSVQKEIIVVLAFAHLHRKPDYWIDRIK
ncbi:MAG: type II toxin-antitoxin system RelE/ParE family toxin [Candidatus Aminicenantes bacterium]|nr:type II toxin-antitoxin system RelE/ParE family toxin [Candidatus Aminicenantes bacterium]